MTDKVIVIGAGPAGAALALALHHAGIDCTVHERDDKPAEDGGHLLSVGANGLEALAAIGIELDGIPIPRLPAYSGSGKLLGELANGVVNGSAPTSLLIDRDTLRRTLQDMLAERGISVEYGKELVSCSATADRATAVFGDGTEVHADALIGADGVHSPTRKALFPDAPAERFTSILGVAGRAQSDRLSPTPDVVVNVFGHNAFFSYHAEPDGTVHWLGYAPGGLDKASTKDWKPWLLDVYGRDMAPVREALEQTTGPIDIRPVHNVANTTPWQRGRIALIGDAARTATPRIGAGTGLAFEDAVIIAKCLRDLPSPHAAFPVYQRLRGARVNRVIKWGRLYARPPKIRTPWGMWLRDRTWPTMLRAVPSMSSLDWLYQHRVDWPAPVLP
ncbi:FAD-dependent monooxygenase [Allokutzneria sp. NRRL B-24872]|uniref:FAD-dependent monooxygenase n=1 Tax=Allokutzneria sp. NRRL B-24872 TaxID=1137961 RepID=UPI000A396192|nr:FAD-dependent monooxygenase [Allokutzneria sp. NRRL B-24872]